MRPTRGRRARPPRTVWAERLWRSGLPAPVKHTGAAYAETGPSAVHDEVANLHSRRRSAVAAETGQPERTVQRHVQRLIEDGWMVRHSLGYHDHTQELHLTVPGTPPDCQECRSKGDNLSLLKGDNLSLLRETPTTPLKGDRLSPLVVTYAPTPGDDAHTGALRNTPDRDGTALVASDREPDAEAVIPASPPARHRPSENGSTANGETATRAATLVPAGSARATTERPLDPRDDDPPPEPETDIAEWNEPPLDPDEWVSSDVDAEPESATRAAIARTVADLYDRER